VKPYLRFSVVWSQCSPVSSRKPSVAREDWCNWTGAALHRPNPSLLICCHKAPETLTHRRPRESSSILSSGARTHECVAAGASLRPWEKWSWQSVTWLFSPVSLSVCQIRGLWLSPVRSGEPVASHLLSLCGGGALGDADEYCKWFHTTPEMLTRLS